MKVNPSVCRHNELVDKNWHFLSLVIDEIKVNGLQELSIRGCNEKKALSIVGTLGSN